jgi:hypothetical protein
MKKILKYLMLFFNFIPKGTIKKPKLIPYNTYEEYANNIEQLNCKITKSLNSDWVKVGDCMRHAMNQIDSDPEYQKAKLNKEKLTNNGRKI